MTVRQTKIETAIGLLGSGYTYKQAAELSGCSQSTLYRRQRNDAAFRRRVEEARSAHLRRATDRLGALTWKAIERLDALLDDESPSVQVRAIGHVLANARAFAEVTEIQERVREIESLLSDDLQRMREANHAA